MTEFLNRPNDKIDSLGAFLGRTFFRLPKEGWRALELHDKDWKTIDSLIENQNSVLRSNLAQLVKNYILFNVDRVKSMQDIDSEINSLIFTSQFDEALKKLNTLDATDQQSLHAFRLFSSLNGHSDEILISKFSDSDTYSAWVRKRFLYPFIYYFVNLPRDRFVDLHLSHLMPPGRNNEIEKRVIKFFLRDEIAHQECLEFKLYVSLLSHPYDVCEFLCNHIEIAYSTNFTLNSVEDDLLEFLVQTAPNPRVQRLYHLTKGRGYGFQLDCPDLSLIFGNRVDESAATALSSLLTVNATSEPPVVDTKYWFLTYLAGNLQNAYPTADNYETLLVGLTRYHYLDVGRLMRTILAAVYLLPRQSAAVEARDFFRMTMFLGAITPLTCGMPSGRDLLKRGRLNYSHAQETQPIEDTSSVYANPTEFGNRYRIPAIHWGLSKLQADGQFQEWLTIVRQNIPIRPAYLTGIDWVWIRQIIDEFRIRPFVQNANGLYTLLLEQVELERNDVNTLRAAMRPFLRGLAALGDVVTWLDSEFLQISIALWRYFFTADQLLWLETF